MTDLPAFTAQIAFTSNFYAAPTWTDVTALLITASTDRGRRAAIDVCDPGTAQFIFDNTSGAFDPDDINGPYYGHLRPNKMIRLSVTISATTYTLFTGYIDSMVRDWPGGSEYSTCTVSATDRFKQLARSTITTTRVAETATARLTALLAAVTYKTINADAYASRTVAAHVYTKDDVLVSAQEVARSDGGALFVDTAGTVVFQTSTFRQTNTRSTVSQGRFGNDATSIPVEANVSPAVDDALMANIVRLTMGDGTAKTLTDAAAGLVDGGLDIDLGSTLLTISAEGDARLAEVLNLLVDAKPRWQAITVNCITDADAALQAAGREISDRVTVAFIHPGKSYGYARDQFLESVRHDISLAGGDAQWMTTFGMSNLPGAASVGRTAIP